MPQPIEASKNPIIVDAFAKLKGSLKYPSIDGNVWFMDAMDGMLIETEVNGLPSHRDGSAQTQPIGPFGFHIHDGTGCGPAGTSFEAAGKHLNPTGMHHGNHAGDLPVLFSNKGYSFMIVFTDKLQSKDVIGKTIVIHENPDDFRTDPSGNSGARIACGEIVAVVNGKA